MAKEKPKTQMRTFRLPPETWIQLCDLAEEMRQQDPDKSPVDNTAALIRVIEQAHKKIRKK